MALSVLLPSHDSFVKEEEMDEFSQASADILATGISPNSFLLDRSNGEVKEEMDDQSFREAEQRALLQGLMASVMPTNVIVGPSDGVKIEDLPFKEEPININEKDALLSLAAGQVQSLGVQSTLLDKIPKEEIKEEIDDMMGEASPIPERSSKRRKAQKFPSPDSEDERIYMSTQDIFPPRTKRGRPKGVRYSEEEVAADPKKRRLAHNREAALRYRERKKMETWGMKHTEQQLEHKRARLTETVDDLSREVQIWRRRCLKAFSFYPICNFEERSPLSSLYHSRREVSTSDSFESLSPSPDRCELNRFAASAMLRARKKEQLSLLLHEEADLTTRNNLLRTEALHHYIEIIDLRNKMGLSMIRTSADKSLPLYLNTSQFSSTQISDLLLTTQS